MTLKKAPTTRRTVLALSMALIVFSLLLAACQSATPAVVQATSQPVKMRLAMLPIIVLFLFAQKYIIKGMVEGSIK